LSSLNVIKTSRVTKIISLFICFCEIELQLKQDKDIWNELRSLANQYYASGIPFQDIREKLIERFRNEELVNEVVDEVRSEIYAQKRKEGTSIIGIGLMLILAGFIITCFNYHSNQSVSMAMYGLTTIGIIVVFVGLYKIMG